MEDEWISIKDRMPKEGELVRIRSWAETEAYYFKHCKLTKWIQLCEADTKGKVTHWRPVIENINEEEEDGQLA